MEQEQEVEEMLGVAMVVVVVESVCMPLLYSGCNYRTTNSHLAIGNFRNVPSTVFASSATSSSIGSGVLRLLFLLLLVVLDFSSPPPPGTEYDSLLVTPTCYYDGKYYGDTFIGDSNTTHHTRTHTATSIATPSTTGPFAISGEICTSQ